MAAIAEEMPYAAVVDQEKIGIYCSNSKCFKRKEKLCRCKGCKFVAYCDKDCQKADWKDHKDECSILVLPVPETTFHQQIRLIIRVFFKIRRGDLGSSFNGRTINDLMDHGVEIRKSYKFADVEKLTVFLGIYLQTKKPTMDEVLSAYGKVQTNSFTLDHTGGCWNTSYGTGLYIGFSAHNHSCAPDAHYLFEGPKMILRSFDKDMKYSKAVTIPYLSPMLKLREERQNSLMRSHYFLCRCSMCEDPQWDRLGRGVTCKYCEDGVCPVYEGMSQEDLVCNSCGKPSKITVNMALNTNRQAEQWLNAKGEDIGSFESQMNKYEYLSKILAFRNIFRLKLALRMMGQSYKLDRRDLCLKYCTDIVLAQRIFPAYPIKAFYLRNLARMQNPLDKKKMLTLLEPAYECALVSVGTNHFITHEIVEARKMLKEFLKIT